MLKRIENKIDKLLKIIENKEIAELKEKNDNAKIFNILYEPIQFNNSRIKR